MSIRIKSLFIVFIFILNGAFSYSQSTLQIKGELIDSIANSPLSYANILLKGKNDTVVAGTISDDDGKFMLTNINYSEGMHILIKYIGYIDKNIDLPNDNNTTVKINLGKIYIQQSEIQLKGLVIEGTQDYIGKKFDRMVYNINENKVSAARTVLDLLRTLPGVVVNEDGTVRYKGAEAIIYVDDQLLKFVYPKIEMIPVERIDKIELIDAAMRTGGDGRGGIINIKFKTVNQNGLSGMISANAGTVKFENLDKSKVFLNLNYKYNKFTYFINSSFESAMRNAYTESVNDMTLFEVPSIQNSSYQNSNKRFGSYNYIGAIYNPSPNTKLYVSYCFLYSTYKMQSENLFSEYNKADQETLNQYKENVNFDDKQINTGITVSYWHKFDTLDTYIKIFGGGTMYNGFSNSNSVYNYSTINSVMVDSVYNYLNERAFYSKSLYFNLFYNHSITKSSRWNLSYNLTLGIQDSSANKHYVFDKLDLSQSQFGNNFNQHHDLSFRIGTKIGKWTIDGGINLLDEFIDGNYFRYSSSDSDTTIPLSKNYIKLLPSATIAFAITDATEIKLSLSKTTDFPYFRQLSDYIDKNNLYNWYSGNSELKPVDFYSIYLGYMISKENLNASAECFFNYTNNEVANVSIPLTSLIALTKPENVSQNTNTGIDLSIWYMVNNRLNFSLSSSIFHTYFNTESLASTAATYDLPVDNLIKRQFGYYIKGNIEYNLKKFYAMFYINYYAKELTFDGYNKGFINSSFNISRKFLTNRLRVTLGINNIFDNLVEHGSYSNSFGVINNTTITGSNYERNYNITVQYNFRQGDRGTKDLR